MQPSTKKWSIYPPWSGPELAEGTGIAIDKTVVIDNYAGGIGRLAAKGIGNC